MKFNLTFAAVLSALSLLVSCSDINIGKELEYLTNRVTLLENQLRQVNSDINLLNEIVNGTSVTNFEKLGENEYRITLGNGTNYVIKTGGTGGTVNLDLSIDEDGYWMLNGEKMEDEAGEYVCAKGTDGAKPVFGVDSEGYWTVKYGEDETPARVTDENGDPVKVQGDTGGSDGGLIASVSENNGKLTIVLNDNRSYSLPLVADFYCRIVDAPEEIVHFVYDEEKIFVVEMKGVVDVAITVPYGWQAWLGDDNATLTVKAPASPGTRAGMADSRRDVILEAQGASNAYCITKIKVDAAETVTEPSTDIYQKYSDGEDIEIAGVKYNKSVYGEPILLTATEAEDVDLRDHIKDGGAILFLKEDGGFFKLTKTAGNVNIKGDVVIVSADVKKKVSVSVASDATIRLFNGSFVAQNVNFDVSAMASNVFEFHKDAQADFERLHFDACEFHHVVKNFVSVGTNTFAVKSVIFENSVLEMGSAGNQRLLHLASTTVMDRYQEIRFKNNVIYNSVPQQMYLTFVETGNLDIFKEGTEWDSVNVTVENNTFYNVPCSRAYLYFYKAGVLNVRRNIFYNEDTWTGGCNIFHTFMSGHPTDCPDIIVEDNVAYGMQDGSNYNVCNPGSTFKNPVNTIEKSETDPLATKDASTGTFVQASGFSSYGARL